MGTPEIARAESIALLHLLHSIPAPPSRNPVNTQNDNGRYTLPFERERSLASTLAFLSSTTDDPEYIPAVCLEEDRRAGELNVFLAVNRANQNDGRQVLRRAKKGFEKIFAVLSQLRDERTPNYVENEVFSRIVIMCQNRILRRLRFIASSSSWKRPKQPIKELLEDAVRAIDQIDGRKLKPLHSAAKSFVKRAKDVMRLADSWVKYRTTARLRVLVEGVSRLWQISELEALLDSMPNRSMDPSSRSSLLDIVRKVARYKQAARYLYRTAKKFPLAQRMKIVLVDLPLDAFCTAAIQQYSSALPSTMSRIDTRHGQWDIDYICRLLKTTEAEASKDFRQQVARTLSEGKIHAEIQLLLHFELNASPLPPRVVSSSKDACFLCNVFIATHGKMHTSRSHGRLYPGWRLPPFPKSDETERDFSQALENHIQSSIATLLARKEKTSYPAPCESTLSTLHATESTVSGSRLAEATVLDDTLLNSPSFDDLSLDDSALDDSALDHSALDDSALDCAALGDPVPDDPARDNAALDDTLGNSPLDDSPLDDPLLDDPPLDDSPLNNSLLDSSPLDSSPLGSSPFNDSPINGSPFNDSPINGSPFNDSPINGSPFNGRILDGLSLYHPPLNDIVLDAADLHQPTLDDPIPNNPALNDAPLGDAAADDPALNDPAVDDAAPNDTTVEDAAPDDSTHNGPTADDHALEATAPGNSSALRDRAADDPAPGDTAPGDTAPGDTAPDDPAPDDSAPGDPAPNDSAPDDPPPDYPVPDHPVPDDPAPDEPVPDDLAPDDVPLENSVLQATTLGEAAVLADAIAFDDATTLDDGVGQLVLYDGLVKSTSPQPISIAETSTLESAEELSSLQIPSDMPPESTASILSSPLASSSTSTIDEDGEIIQGQTLCRTIKATRKSSLYRAGGLEIIFKYPAGPGAARRSRKVAYSVEWLTAEEVEKLHESQKESIVDAESLEDEMTLKANLDCYYIAGRGSVLKIRLS